VLPGLLQRRKAAESLFLGLDNTAHGARAGA